MKSNKRVVANLVLLLTAAIWGMGFVAQKVGSEFVGAYTFNGIRFALGSLSLVPLIVYFDRKNKDKVSDVPKPTSKQVIKSGIILGLILFIAASLQQIGMTDSTAGKGGFITGLYMVFVPIFGLFLGHKIGKNIWIGVVAAVVGLYLLSIKKGFEIEFGDFLILVGAVFWAVHILFIDNFSKKIDALKLSSIQFATCAVLSLITAFATETITLEGLKGSLIPILYGGLLSVGVAYTLQVVAQKNAKPSHAAIILSMESVFAALGGMIILSESLTVRAAIGCALILVGILITQIEPNQKVEIHTEP